jgi:integrase
MVAPARRELATTNRDVASGRCLPGARRRRVTRGGLRIGETLSLRWRDVDLPRGTITVQKAKTDAGVRAVKVLPVLQEELGVYRPENADPDAIVFGTSTGGRQGATNVRRRVLAPAVELATSSSRSARSSCCRRA